MLDHCMIFHKSGMVLWKKDYVAWGAGEESLMDVFIKEVLVTQKENVLQSWASGVYGFTWKIVNALEIVVVLVYQKMLVLPYVDDLADSLATEFCKAYEAVLNGGIVSISSYDQEFHFDKSFEKLFKTSFQKFQGKNASTTSNNSSSNNLSNKNQKNNQNQKDKGKDAVSSRDRKSVV